MTTLSDKFIDKSRGPQKKHSYEEYAFAYRMTCEIKTQFILKIVSFMSSNTQPSPAYSFFIP